MKFRVKIDATFEAHDRDEALDKLSEHFLTMFEDAATIHGYDPVRFTDGDLPLVAEADWKGWPTGESRFGQVTGHND